MVVVFDADFLSLLLNQETTPPVDPTTGTPVEQASQRIEALVQDLSKSKSKVIVPTPALAEFLVIADESGPNYLDAIESQSVFQVEPFDQRAAVEAAAMMRAAVAAGNKKAGAVGPWQSVKIDRQIVAIAKVLSVDAIYSNDGDVKTLGEQAGIKVLHVSDLPLPESKTPLLDAVEPMDDSIDPAEPPSSE